MANTFSLPMSTKEIDRLDILRRLLRSEISGPMAANSLALSTRQVRRLKASVKKNGALGLIHGNRGKPSPNRLPDNERKRIVIFWLLLIALFLVGCGTININQKIIFYEL